MQIFVVTRNGSDLLGMPNIEQLDILSIACRTMDMSQRCREIDSQMVEEKCYTDKKSNHPNPMVIYSKDYIIDYIVPDPSRDTDKNASAKIAKIIYDEFKNVSPGIGAFEGIFTLQVIDGNKPLQMSLRCSAYTLQQLFIGELE